jgi:hypothetical protein
MPALCSDDFNTVRISAMCTTEIIYMEKKVARKKERLVTGNWFHTREMEWSLKQIVAR